MKILVFNCGSSSIKYQLFAMPTGERLAKGSVERIGEAVSRASQTSLRGSLEFAGTICDHQQGLRQAIAFLTDPENGAVTSVSDIAACGHRVVHGGEAYSGSVLIDDALISGIEDFCELAPLHNPPNLTGIREAKSLLGVTPQVACFDTAFHQTIPEVAYLYGLPYDLYAKHRIRRYGFHGTSHHYVARRAAEMLGKPLEEVNLITCHLGNGCSVTAIRNGKSIDTSMGFTPLEGVMMGTRTGNFDPAILLYLSGKGYTTAKLDRMVNKESGLLGISGSSNDLRDLEGNAAAGDRRAQLALAMFAYSIRKYIGAYLAVLNGCHAIVFTGGIGEYAATMRERIVGDLNTLGISLDREKNAEALGRESEITGADGRIRLLVIPTDEERMIAMETYNLINEELTVKG